jgi:hypothetical protein
MATHDAHPVVARRRPEAVKELEMLQQEERKGAGEPPLTVDEFMKLMRDDLEQQVIREQLRRGGLGDAIEHAGDRAAIVDARFRALVDAWHLDDPAQWSRYETAGTRWQIATLCAEIETVFANHHWALSEVPVVGTLTTGQVSAVTQMTAAGAPLVLIDNGFFRFAGAMSQLAVYASYDAANRGFFTEGTLQLVSDLAATHTALNTVLYAPVRQTPPAFVNRVDSWQRAISAFVLAHEYAHIAAGDLDEHPRDGSSRPARSKEFHADEAGLTTALEVTRSDAGVFGAVLYFAGVDLLDRASAVFHGRRHEFESGTESDYPTPFERTVNLLQRADSDGDPRLQSAFKSASAAYNTILFAWDQVLPSFREALGELRSLGSNPPPGILPEAHRFAVMETVWQRVLARARRS